MKGTKRPLLYAAAILLGATVAGTIMSSTEAQWRPLWLVATLALLGVLGDRLQGRTGRMRLSAGFLMVALAMALLGPAPAVAICFLSRIIDAIRTDGLALRGRRLALAWNLGMYANVLAGGLLILAAVHAGVTRGSPNFALIVVAAITIANAINFVLAALWVRASNGVAVRTQFRKQFVPTLPWTTAPNLLAAALATLYYHAGAVSILLAVGLLGAFYMLLAELLRSRERSEQLASLQVGLLVTMVRTLSLRDKGTARHSAAVARYARELAKAAGYSEADQNLVHTAGLLHDIGKFAFPDRILLASHRLSEEDWAIVKQHPRSGAQLVGRVDGYEDVAAIILAHHERIDGCGYPRGLAADQIPVLSKVISVADVYDVITGRDTYRSPVTRAQAMDELRRVAGTQLDAELVEAFIGVLVREGVGFTHTEDSDFEAELAFEERVRELAQPRRRSAAAAAAPA